MQRVPVRPQGAVFDCDGTLVDSMEMWYQMESEIASRAGHAITTEEADLLRSLTLPESGAWFYEQLGVGSSAQDVVDTINDMAHEFYATRAEARPGVLEFVRAVAQAGVGCAVASSSPHTMLDCGIVCAGLGSWIPQGRIVSVDDVGVSKREPDVYDRARRLIGSPLEATWVFEDAVYAVRTAKRAGYRVLAVWNDDGSGTIEELAAEADVAFKDWRDIDVEKFLAGGYARCI